MVQKTDSNTVHFIKHMSINLKNCVIFIVSLFCAFRDVQFSHLLKTVNLYFYKGKYFIMFRKIQEKYFTSKFNDLTGKDTISLKNMVWYG